MGLRVVVVQICSVCCSGPYDAPATNCAVAPAKRVSTGVVPKPFT